MVENNGQHKHEPNHRNDHTENAKLDDQLNLVNTASLMHWFHTEMFNFVQVRRFAFRRWTGRITMRAACTSFPCMQVRDGCVYIIYIPGLFSIPIPAEWNGTTNMTQLIPAPRLTSLVY